MSYDANSSDALFSRVLQRLDTQDSRFDSQDKTLSAILAEIKATRLEHELTRKEHEDRLVSLETQRDVFRGQALVICTGISGLISFGGWFVTHFLTQ